MHPDITLPAYITMIILFTPAFIGAIIFIYLSIKLPIDIFHSVRYKLAQRLLPKLSDGKH
jgi:hypothetical protein